MLLGALIAATAVTTEAVLGILAGPVVIGAQIATVTTPAAADDNGLRVLSVDGIQPLSPSIVVGRPDEVAGQVLSPAAFVALDDDTTPPIVRDLAVSGQPVTLTLGVAEDEGWTNATWRVLGFFAVIATVMTLTVVIASTSTAAVRRGRRVGRR